MNRTESIAILTILKTAYPRFYTNMSKTEAEKTISLWQEMFNDTDIQLLTLSIKSLISHLEFPPTIADVKKEILKLTTKKEEVIDYWNEAYSMLRNGIYMTKENFEKYSTICQRYFGTLQRLKTKSMQEDLNLEVEQSLFNQYCKNALKEKQEEKLLPADIKIMLQATADKLKYLGG